MRTQTFLIRCEYPDGDSIPTQEFVENIEEYFAANIMDGERGRLVVKPVYQPKEQGLYKTESRIPTISELFDFIFLVKRMRDAQKEYDDAIDKVYSTHAFFGDNMPYEVHELLRKLTKEKKALQKEVDEYLKKME